MCACSQPSDFKSHKNSHIQLFIFVCFSTHFPSSKERARIEAKHARIHSSNNVTKRRGKTSHNENKLQKKRKREKRAQEMRFKLCDFFFLNAFYATLFSCALVYSS